VAFTWVNMRNKTEPTRHFHCVGAAPGRYRGYSLFFVAKTPLVAMLAMALWTAGNCGFFVTFWPTCNMLVGKKTVAKTIALINSGSLLGNFLLRVFRLG